jgi:anhydro-N-acetylmuramic acid kinase
MKALKQEFFSLGLMSGSSLDGLDICYSKIFVENNLYGFEILSGTTVQYPVPLAQALRDARNASAMELSILDIELGVFFGSACSDMLAKSTSSPLDFISSHGHTIFHHPEKGISLQIGNGQQIAKQTGIKTLTNLRQNDIAHGGSGAPIVPIGDHEYFS